jgi:myotubularin-related protein 1/2
MEGIICETYPNFIYTLKDITDEELNKCAKFRTKKRFPALTWSSKNNRGTLWRSSQNKTGVIQKRCNEDEKLLNFLQKTTQKLHIYDARPYLNALANKMKGAGFENSLNYKNSHVFFCDIDNIHAVRDSFEKVKTLSQLNL